jgi:hypothetical protein
VAELRIGDRVVSVQSPSVPIHEPGRVDQLGTAESLDIPPSLLQHHRDEPIAHVVWDTGQANYVWVKWLQVLPESLTADDVERWLERG